MKKTLLKVFAWLTVLAIMLSGLVALAEEVPAPDAGVPTQEVPLAEIPAEPTVAPTPVPTPVPTSRRTRRSRWSRAAISSLAMRLPCARLWKTPPPNTPSAGK